VNNPAKQGETSTGRLRRISAQLYSVSYRWLVKAVNSGIQSRENQAFDLMTSVICGCYDQRA
jgi:hypothetical protein